MTVFLSERVKNIFNMVISGMKTHFTPNDLKKNMVGLQIRTLNFFTVFKKKIAILIHSA